MNQKVLYQTPSFNHACRFCGSSVRRTFVDLGMSPLCESYISSDQWNDMEPFYPLHVRVCDACFLVQLEAYVNPAHIFTEYAYFSSFASTWLEHCKSYTELMKKRFNLNEQSLVVEIASNDGYLLQYFIESGIPVLGIEPATNVAQIAIEKAVPTLIDFFGSRLAQQLADDGHKADLLVGNNVLAQIPELNDFVSGMKTLLKTNGVITMEFPHLMKLIEGNQFDTIYHEHFSYFSFTTVEKIFAAHGLSLFDVEEISTHGGSLRIYACHQEDNSKVVSDRVALLKAHEASIGLTQPEYYAEFTEKVRETKWKLLDFLIQAKRSGKKIIGYGAPGKGNTLLNYCGIRTDFLEYTVDRNPYKQGKFLPGTRIPIYHPSKISESKPDYVLILPWNFKDEIMDQMSSIRSWGGQFIVPIPEVMVYS